MRRRDFLKYLFAWGGAAVVPASLVSCSPPTNVGSQSLAQTVGMPNGRSVWVWLRMFETGGNYSVPSSETAYKQHMGTIDVAMPTNGGELRPDGTWFQESWKIDRDWPQELPHLAKAAGHLYIPTVINDRDAIAPVLADSHLHSVAADELVALATTERFDAPWDGVLLDIEATPAEYRAELSDFYYLVSERLRAAGLLVGISVAGQTEDIGAYDFAVVAEAADVVDLRCYGYWKPLPRSIGPYWWLEACIQFALSKGIQRQQLLLGVGNFSRYWPDSDNYGSWAEITYKQAMQLVEEAKATVEWIESNKNGLVREEFAKIGDGHLWIHDAQTYQYGLDLIDQYQLLGDSLFAVGMGNDSIWQVIQNWRLPEQVYLPYMSKPASDPYP